MTINVRMYVIYIYICSNMYIYIDTYVSKYIYTRMFSILYQYVRIHVILAPVGRGDYIVNVCVNVYIYA